MAVEGVAREAHGVGTWVESLAQLKAGFRGEIIKPDDAAYESARKVWNGMIDRRPGVIVRPTGAADVAAAVRFARSHDVLVSVRGGGHNVAGNAVCDDGMVIDLSKMKGIRVDPVHKTVWVQAGAVWADVDHETQAYGLATTGGLVGSTGIAGFTLGGGVGWLMRSYGLACDNLVGAELVTADGRFVRANAGENPDLFWGLRGGGGNFGVVTAFEFRLHEVGPVIYGGLLLYPFERTSDLLRFFGTFTEGAPDALTATFVFVTAPFAPFIPAAFQGQKACGVMFCYNGTQAEGEKAVKALLDFGKPALEMVGPMPYAAFQTMLDEGEPPGHMNYWKSHYLNEIRPEAIESLVAHCAEVPSALSEAHIQHLGAAVARVPTADTAFPNRRSPYVLNVLGKWTDPRENERNIRWVRSTWDAMRPFATGGIYVNFLGDTTEDAVRASYGEGQYERLAALKAKYDPTNFFRMNHNIAPAQK